MRVTRHSLTKHQAAAQFYKKCDVALKVLNCNPIDLLSCWHMRTFLGHINQFMYARDTATSNDNS